MQLLRTTAITITKSALRFAVSVKASTCITTCNGHNNNNAHITNENFFVFLYSLLFVNLLKNWIYRRRKIC